MTNNYLKRTIKTGITGVLTLSLVLSAMPVSTALAKTGPHFAKSKLNIEVGKTKTVKIKGIKKKLIKKIIVRSTQKKVAAAKANGKTAITVSAKKKGKVRIKVTLKLKKSLNGTKNHKLILKVSVKKSTASSPTPAPTQTAEPATSTTPSPSVLPTTAPVTPAAAVLTDINQTKSDAVEFIFDTDTFLVEKEIKREDLGIDLLNEKKESIQNISVNEIITSKDGLTVTASLAKAFTDKGLYRFSYNGKTVDKVMNVGKPESIFISTSMAEKNVATPIEFTLIDGSGIDVTGANRLDTTCSIEAKGDHTSFDNSRASQTTITFDSVGQRSEVTVTYNSGADGEKDIISTPTTITCVAPTAKIGTPLHLVASKSSRKTWDDDEDGCAMFYDGGSNSVPVCYLNEENNNLFFCATDENDAVIPYDEYSVVPANRAVCDAEVIRNTERYAQIRFSGNKVGDTNLNVICTSNGVQSSYIVGVKVKERPPIRSVKIESEFAKMTNVYDEDYKSRIDISVTDTEGNKADPESYSTPVITLQSISGAKPADFKKYTQQEWSNTSFTDEQKAKIMSLGLFEKKEDGEMIFTAWGLPAATYTLKAEVTSADNANITKSGTCKIVVENLYGKEFAEAEKLESETARDGNAYFSPDSEGGIKSSLGIFSVTYKAEAPKKVTSSYCYARLYAVVNGKFAGYVRYIGAERDGDGEYYIGGIADSNNDNKLENVLRATAATRLKKVVMTLNFNGKYPAIVSTDPQNSPSESGDTGGTDNENEDESEINGDLKSYAELYDIRRRGFSIAKTGNSSYGENVPSAKVYTISNADNRYVVEGRPDIDTYYAVSGKNCQVKFAITTGGFAPDDTGAGSGSNDGARTVPEKKTDITGSFAVDVTPVFPTVKVHSAKVSSFYQDGLMPVLSCNWDMNASSTNKSIIEAPVGRFVYDTTKDGSEINWDIGWVKKDPISTADSMLCSYVAVKDDDTIYYCKTDITFTET